TVEGQQDQQDHQAEQEQDPVRLGLPYGRPACDDMPCHLRRHGLPGDLDGRWLAPLPFPCVVALVAGAAGVVVVVPVGLAVCVGLDAVGATGAGGGLPASPCTVSGQPGNGRGEPVKSPAANMMSPTTR